MTTEVFFITQLCLIPQITSKIATEIVKKYSSINMLIAAYDITPEKLRNQLLSEINYNLQNNKTRRLGDKISTRVYHYFYGISSIV
jgi:hypothetical protein